MGCPQKSNKCKNGHDNNCACIEKMKTKLQQIESQRCMLEDKLAKLNRIKAEVADKENQLASMQQCIDDMTVNRQQQYDKLIRKVDMISAKYEQVIQAINQFKQDNDDLQSNINTKAAQDLQIVNKIKELECIKTRTCNCVNEIKEKNRCEQGRLDELARKQACLEKAVACKSADTQTLCRDLKESETAVHLKSEQLEELRCRNIEWDRTLRESEAECQKQEAELSALLEDGPRQLDRAERSAAAVCEQLADARAKTAEWTARREHATAEHRRAKAAIDAETCRMRSAVDALVDERDRLEAQLSDAQGQLQAAEKEKWLLAAQAEAGARRLACFKAEMDRLEEHGNHGRLMMTMHKTKCETEMALLEQENVVKAHRLAFVENELDALRRTGDQHNPTPRGAAGGHPSKRCRVKWSDGYCGREAEPANINV